MTELCCSTNGFDGPWWRYPALRNALIAGALTVVAFGLAHLGIINRHIELALYFAAIPLGGWYWMREAIEELVAERAIGIDMLMVAATAGSGALGLWDEAAFLVFLYGAAEGLEEYTYARTRYAIRALLDLAPKEAHVLREGREVVVPAETLQPGDRFLVRPGESIPTDGIVRVGISSVDESPVTGESIPVDKKPGMKVFAAAINHQGALEIEATTTFQNNTLAKIIHLVEQAQERKGKAQQWIERFGRRYTPLVLAASALLMLVPWTLGLPLTDWSLRAVVLLVAAAPCALVMSMPVAMAAGIGAAGKHGILIKGGAHLEHLGKIRAVAFDKTGTLTYGQPAVTDIVALQGSNKEVLTLAAALERYSEHPLARALIKRAQDEQTTLPDIQQFEALPGAGAKGLVDGREWHIGNPDLLRRVGADLAPVQARIDALQEQGKTVVLVGNPERIRGLIAFQDRIRPNAATLVARLRALGIEVVMLTGDNLRSGHAVSRALGIDAVRAELKPEQKVRAVRELLLRHGSVLMVGDGVNDAPALAAATCGMAMGVAGTDAAIEAADVALMSDDVLKIEEALHYGRKVRRISTQNIVFSLIVLAVLIPLALSGVLSVAVAVLAHEVSELLAVANGLRAGLSKTFTRTHPP